MSLSKTASLTLAAAIASIFAGVGTAEVVPVNNPSFESPVLADGLFPNFGSIAAGWTAMSSGNAGIWNPSASQVESSFISGIPDGNQVAFTNGPNFGQTLSTKVGYGYLYTLRVSIGGRINYSYEPYGVVLAGTAPLTVLSEERGQNSPGWFEEVVQFEANDRAIEDLDLRIELHNRYALDSSAATNGQQLNFDNVRLTRAKLVSCAAFLPPFDDALVLKKKDSRAIPVKMELYDYLGNELTDADLDIPPVVDINYIPGTGVGDPADDLVSAGLADDGNAFRYDPVAGHWILNLAAKIYSSPGQYKVTVEVGDTDFALPLSGTCSQTFTRLP